MIIMYLLVCGLNSVLAGVANLLVKGLAIGLKDIVDKE